MAKKFEMWDYITMSSVIALSSFIGVYQAYKARKTKGTVEFLVINKQIGVAPLILSLVATYLSAISMLGFPSDIFTYGLSFSFVSASIIIAAPIGSHLILPLLFQNNISSIFQYLELRFCKSLRICASLCSVLQMFFAASFMMYAPALALSHVTGLTIWTSVLTIGGVSLIYTAIGGIKAVVWAEFAQCFVMIGVYFIIIFRGAYLVGGSDIIWERLKYGNRSSIIEWSTNVRYPIWTMAIGYTIFIVTNISFNQSMVQRYLSNKTLKDAKITSLGGAFGVAMVYVMLAFAGIIAYAYFHDCDPLLSGQISNRDQIIPLFAMETLSFCEGLPGVFVAGIMCASLSSITSRLNSMVALTLTDYISFLKPNMAEQTKRKLSVVLVLVYGLLCIALVALVENMEGLFMAVTSMDGIFGGPRLVAFVTGMLLPWINSKGAVVGFITSMILPAWAWIRNMIIPPTLPSPILDTSGCSNLTVLSDVQTDFADDRSFIEMFYSISPIWYTTWSLISGTIVALIVSGLTGFSNPNEVDPKLIFPFMRRYFFSQSNSKENEIKIRRDEDQL